MARLVAGLVGMLLLVVASMQPAHADPGAFDIEGDQSEYLDFYTPPDPLPAGRPGDLIRTEPSRLALEPSGQLGAYVATGTRIMYRSTDARDNPVAVTGTYFEPDNPWPGRGPRPLLSFAVGTHGQGDQCAPSRLFNQGIHWSPWFDIMLEYEEGFIATLVARGFAVVVTDYEGLGTPGVHTYLNRLAEGQAVLDAARAARLLPGTSLDPHGPVGLFGYSQGGGAVASAAELAPTYAPDLDLVGTFAGAPPANPAEAMPYADGSMMVGLVGYILNGLIAAYPESEGAVHDKLTPRGEDLLAKTRHQCVMETSTKFQFRHLQPYFTEDLTALAEEEPFKTLFDLQRIGRFKPDAPVLIDINRFDPLVPWTAANQLARDWCAQGADVEFRTNEEPAFLNKTAMNHILTSLVDGESAMQWMADRFNGVPSSPNCDRS
jgi:hypothetical protein